jgi:ferric-dicitrate binding protein FerR (iron transport regulator)
MSDDIMEAGEMADVELVTRFLNRQLDPDEDARVRARIENDAAFREFAAPLIIAWSVPPRSERQPRPAGEKERMWDEFTRRAGFVHQRRAARKRKLWMLGIVVLAVALSSFAFRDAIRDRYVALTKYQPVADSGREIRLHDSAFVTLKAGARLRSSRKPVNPNAYGVLLAGSGRFRVEQMKMDNGLPRGLIVQAGDAVVASGGAVFDVATRGDTTFVQVIDRQLDWGRASGFGVSIVAPEAVLLANKIPTADQLVLKSGELGRVVRGHKPELLRRAPITELPPADTIARSGAPPTQREQRVGTVRVPGAGITISKRVGSGGIPPTGTKFPSAEPREQETHTAYMPVDVVLSDGTHAHLDSGAIVQTPLKPKEGEAFAVTLQGSARFRAVREPAAVTIRVFAVATPTAYVATQRADFAVTQHGDTVLVELFHTKHATGADPDRVSMSGTNELLDLLIIEEGQRARSVAGRPAVLLPPRPSPDSARVELRKP